MAASPIVEVKNGSGAYVDTPGGVNVTAGNTISIRLKSTTDVTDWNLQVFGVDEITDNPPTLINVNSTTHEVTSPSTVVTFVMPAGSGIGRAIIFRSSVNGGGSGFTTTFGVYVLTALGNRVAAVGERFEGNAEFGWAAAVNKIIRDGGGGGGGGGLPAFANQQYAVLMEDPAGSLVFQQISQDMITPSFDISIYSKTAPNGGQLQYRRGETVTGVAVSVNYVSGPPSSASIVNSFGGSSNGGDVNPGAWTINSPFATGTLAGSVKRNGSDLGADPTMTATLTALKGASSKQDSFTLTWTRDVYWGVDAAGLNTEASIEGLANTTLAASRSRTLTVSPSNQKVYYAFPKAYGTATFTLNGFPASFNAPSEISVTNVNSVMSTYYLYESTNLLTGSNLNFVVT